VPGPDVIVGDVEDVAQFDAPVGTQVGLAIGQTLATMETSRSIGLRCLNRSSGRSTELYRMSGGVTNDDRFEQIGQSWMKHTFLALEDFVCGLVIRVVAKQAHISAPVAPTRTRQD